VPVGRLGLERHPANDRRVRGEAGLDLLSHPFGARGVSDDEAALGPSQSPSQVTSSGASDQQQDEQHAPQAENLVSPEEALHEERVAEP
jgi:hypothetical protein